MTQVRGARFDNGLARELRPGGIDNNIYYSLTPSSSTMTLKKQQSATQLADFTGSDQNNADRGIHIMGKILI